MKSFGKGNQSMQTMALIGGAALIIGSAAIYFTNKSTDEPNKNKYGDSTNTSSED